MRWFAVRSVYLCRTRPDGTNIFEERVVGFSAESADDAHEKAFAEADAYAASNKFVAYDEQRSYEQDGDPLIDGYELWSQLFESKLSLDDFYAARYSGYEYHPD